LPREPREFNGKKYLLQHAIEGDFGLVRAWKADYDGNLIYHKTARNFNPDIATAKCIKIAEVDEIVAVGELGPNEIVTPGIYIDRVVKGVKEQRRIEKLALKLGGMIQIAAKTETEKQMRIKIGKRAAAEFEYGMYANLGIGMPTMAANYLDPALNVYLHSENGLLGTGQYPKPGYEDPDLINAGKETVTIRPGASFIHSSVAFNIIRGGHLGMTILGGLEVGENGDLANWIIPGVLVRGMGGAMDLVATTKKVIVVMSLSNKHGEKKLKKNVSLPVTGQKCVTRLITEQAVFNFDKPKGRVILSEISDDTTLENIRALTDVDLIVSDNLLSMEECSSKYTGEDEENIFD